MADVADNEELIATRRLHGLDDDLFQEKRNIEVGEYVRTDKGYIFKIDEEKKNLQIADFFDVEYGKIVKHSKQLINLIEVGDFVNGMKVTYIHQEAYKNRQKEDIKTILTKEQVEANCYKVGGRE